MRSLLVILFLAVLGLLSACTARPRCEAYHFHPSFPGAYREAARTAAARWSAFSGRPVVIEAEESTDLVCSIRAVDGNGPEYDSVKAEMGGQDWAGVHQDHNGAIAIAESRWESNEWCTEDRVLCATYVLMHEIAHEYGLQHVKDPANKAVMSVGSPEPRTEYTDLDRAELRRVTP